MELESIIARITEEVYARLGNDPDISQKKSGLAGHIEYARLDPAMKIGDVRAACETVKAKGYAAICVPQWFVAFAKDMLKGSGVKVCTPVGLPGGASATAAKYAEVREAVSNGADEVEIPANIRLIEKGDLEAAKNDIEEAMMPARGRAVVKVVIEAGALSEEQQVQAVAVAKQCGADYIAISSALAPACLGPAELKKIIAACGGGIRIKVSGCVKTDEDAKRLLDAGAERAGTSVAL